MTENNITITNTVNVPRQSRGAGTVLVVIVFGWLLPLWWSTLAALWIVWMLVAGITSIFQHDFFSRTWYQPWSAWMFGIR